MKLTFFLHHARTDGDQLIIRLANSWEKQAKKHRQRIRRTRREASYMVLLHRNSVHGFVTRASYRILLLMAIACNSPTSQLWLSAYLFASSRLIDQQRSGQGKSSIVEVPLLLDQREQQTQGNGIHRQILFFFTGHFCSILYKSSTSRATAAAFGYSPVVIVECFKTPFTLISNEPIKARVGIQKQRTNRESQCGYSTR
jgi:hypothetical protein